MKQKLSNTTHHISQNPIPTKIKRERSPPNLQFRSPTRRNALHDSENALLSRFGAKMMAKGWSFVWSFNGEWRRREWKREGERESCLKSVGAEWRERKAFWFLNKGFSLFLLFYLSNATCLHLSGAKRAHFPFWLWPILSHKSGENLTFETLKSCLGLRVVSLVPVPRVSLRPSWPVSESKQYIYQNAQNRTPSVVQRLVSLNFKLHAKRWFLD